MVSKVKRRRRETKRVRLGRAVRAELAPLMASHGFRNAPENWDRLLSPTPADFWSRVRGPYTDRIDIYWSYGAAPRFMMGAESDQPGRNTRRPSYVHALSWVISGPFRGMTFGGRFRSIKGTVRRASMRMEDLIRYLDTGEKSRYVDA